MLIQFSVAACLIAATVVIQALFMSIGLQTFKWIEKHRPTMMARKPTMSAEGEVVYQRIQELQPTNDIQRGLQTRISQVTNDLIQARLLLFSHLRSSIPVCTENFIRID